MQRFGCIRSRKCLLVIAERLALVFHGTSLSPSQQVQKKVKKIPGKKSKQLDHANPYATNVKSVLLL